jgi:UDP-N-acetylglucosamine--N-acetylmuramyl-(pentapeptide) pyrophosphoryl-undecaprenol N-acetylglucosamine transferase
MEGERELRCLIAAGGTAGHVLPALAVAEELRTRGVLVTFVGSPGRAESRLVPEAGLELDTLAVAGIPRRVGLPFLRAIGLAGRATLEARGVLARRRPHVVYGGGGFVAGPVVLAAWTRGIPAALAEADAHLGLANRLAAPFAQRVFLAFPDRGDHRAKFVVTGRPIPARSQAGSREAGRRAFGLPVAEPVLLVAGGSQGARSLNRFGVDAFGLKGPAILHLAGDRDYEELREQVVRPDYRMLPWTDEYGLALASADLALARSGASVFELAAAGLPAILVPYPHATADHQRKNAQYFADAGGAVIVSDSGLARVPALVTELLADAGRLAKMAEAMRTVARPDAARVIAEELIGLAPARG